MAKKSGKDKLKGEGKFTPTIVNKKARFNYQFLEKLEAGIALQGTEVKTLRQGKGSLDEAFGRILDGELYLLNCTIPLYEQGNRENHEPTRPRKLLVHRRELHKVQTKLVQKGLTIIPLRIYFSHGLAKVEMALAQGKTFGDKRATIKERQVKRDLDRATRRFDR